MAMEDDPLKDSISKIKLYETRGIIPRLWMSSL